MDTNRVAELACEYEIKLRHRGYKPEPFKMDSIIPTRQEALNHAMWLCEYIPALLREGDPITAARYLGIVQGILWAKEIFGVKQTEPPTKTVTPEETLY